MDNFTCLIIDIMTAYRYNIKGYHVYDSIDYTWR